MFSRPWRFAHRRLRGPLDVSVFKLVRLRAGYSAAMIFVSSRAGMQLLPASSYHGNGAAPL